MFLKLHARRGRAKNPRVKGGIIREPAPVRRGKLRMAGLKDVRGKILQAIALRMTNKKLIPMQHQPAQASGWRVTGISI